MLAAAVSGSFEERDRSLTRTIEDYYEAFLWAVQCNPHFPQRCPLRINLADLGNGTYLVWLGSEYFTVSTGGEVDQVAWAAPLCAGIHIATCISHYLLVSMCF